MGQLSSERSQMAGSCASFALHEGLASKLSDPPSDRCPTDESDWVLLIEEAGDIAYGTFYLHSG